MVGRLTAYLGGVERRLREAELAQARAEALRRRGAQASPARAGPGGVGARHRADRRGRMGLDGPRAAATRASRSEAEVDAALAEASTKRDQARRRGGADPVAWVEAIEAARRAESLLGDGRRGRRSCAIGCGPSWRPSVRERDAAEAAEKDRRMVERLAAIHNDLGVHNDVEKADAEYAAAFRAYGVDLDRTRAGCGRPGAGGQPGRSRRPGQRPRSVGLPAARAGLAGPGRRVDGWSRSPRRPIPTRGGTGSGTRSAGWTSDRARKLEALERLAATADVDHLPEASVTRLAFALAFAGPARHGDRAAAARPGVAPRRLLGQRRPRPRADGLRPSRRGGPVLRRRRGRSSAKWAGPPQPRHGPSTQRSTRGSGRHIPPDDRAAA